MSMLECWVATMLLALPVLFALPMLMVSEPME
jgi:hypothetical protein